MHGNVLMKNFPLKSALIILRLGYAMLTGNAFSHALTDVRKYN